MGDDGRKLDDYYVLAHYPEMVFTIIFISGKFLQDACLFTSTIEKP